MKENRFIKLQRAGRTIGKYANKTAENQIYFS